MSHPLQGYLRQPTLRGEALVFVCEDQLWRVDAPEHAARRLTTGPGVASHPCLSPDGDLLAYIATDEGHSEVTVMNAHGGAPRRLTHHGRRSRVIGWTPQGEILYTSTAGQPFAEDHLHVVSPQGGPPRRLPHGPAQWFSLGPRDDQARRPSLLTRHQDDLARWKRYRGGTAGVMWARDHDQAPWRRVLADLNTNLARGQWLGDRVIFVSDHQGVGNLYALPFNAAPDEAVEALERLTDHQEHYVRAPRVDGDHIVYQCGGRLWRWSRHTGSQQVEVRLYSSAQGRQPRFVSPVGKHLETYALDADAKNVALVCRGKAFTMPLWSGPVTEHRAQEALRTRHLHFIPDSDKLIALVDRGEGEAYEVWTPNEEGDLRRYDGLDTGRIRQSVISPDGRIVAWTNHRFEVGLLTLETGELKTLDRSDSERIMGVAWSPDSAWLAYSLALDTTNAVIRLAEVKSGAIHDATRPGFRDMSPAFDPDGRYLYFTSRRAFDPVYDLIQFDLGFPRGVRLCMILLQDDLIDPFTPGAWDQRAPPKDNKNPKKKGKGDKRQDKSGDKAPKSVKIDLNGLSERVILLPITEGRLSHIQATAKHVYFTVAPVEGALKRTSWRNPEPASNLTLRAMELETGEVRDISTRVSSYTLSPNHKQLILRSGRRLRAMPADGTNNRKSEQSGKRGGWLELGRVRLHVTPTREWRQMAHEAWRLMREHYWRGDLGGADWDAIWTRYSALLPTLGSREDLSDLLREMQGELDTSHAYAMGGDIPMAPSWQRGFLAATLTPAPTGGERITRIVAGDRWDTRHGSPLARPGVKAAEGDVILAVDGCDVTPQAPVAAHLTNKAGAWVRLTLQRDDERWDVTVKTLRSEVEAHYRQWVEANQARVEAATDGMIGYVHIPDMGPRGYAQFHRAWLAQIARPGLIIDVRYNGGGHVSQLLIQKLAVERMGYVRSRWRSVATPYPRGAKNGPIVGLTNERAGSDGDIFSQVFKLSGLGPLVGRRTWGGTVGIRLNHRLIDGGLTTQPEFAHWFKEVGFGLENHGTEVDIDVDISPDDYAAGRDPQLEAAIDACMGQLKDNPPSVPEDVWS